jgi:hypothetical protein
MMRQACFLAAIASVLLSAAPAKKGDNPFAGRWDLTVTTPTATYPAWIEVVDQEGAPAVRIQPRGGFVRPAAEAKMEGSRLIVTISPATADRPAITWEFALDKNKQLTGSIHRAAETQGQIAGVRAPELKNKPPKSWAPPEPLFNGKDLTGWEPGNPNQNHWVARNGELLNEEAGSNLRTTRKFDDFKLHLEFNCPEGANSGIYLRGRYQVQIDYQPQGAANKLHGMGAIYGYLAPSVDLPPRPGEWETMDITLIGRYVTVVRNGATVIDNQEIAGITGGALDSNEAAPGPFNLQGTLAGGIRYRNLTVSMAKKQ